MKNKKIVFLILRILLASMIAFSIWMFVKSLEDASGQTIDQQETCPDGVDGWIKIQPLSGYEYTYTAPEGFLVAETCSKAGTTVEYNVIDPPQKTVTIVSNVQQELSHVAIRLISETVTSTPLPTWTRTPTQIQTPTPGDPSTSTPTPTPDPSITVIVTPTITSTIFYGFDTTPDQPSGGEGINFGVILAFTLSAILIIGMVIVYYLSDK